jgi:hypothetical protein
MMKKIAIASVIASAIITVSVVPAFAAGMQNKTSMGAKHKSSQSKTVSPKVVKPKIVKPK